MSKQYSAIGASRKVVAIIVAASGFVYLPAFAGDRGTSSNAPRWMQTHKENKHYSGYRVCGSVARGDDGTYRLVNICPDPLEFHFKNTWGDGSQTVRPGGWPAGYPAERGTEIVAICSKNDSFDKERGLCKRP